MLLKALAAMKKLKEKHHKLVIKNIEKVVLIEVVAEDIEVIEEVHVEATEVVEVDIEMEIDLVLLNTTKRGPSIRKVKPMKKKRKVIMRTRREDKITEENMTRTHITINTSMHQELELNVSKLLWKPRSLLLYLRTNARSNQKRLNSKRR